jgi:hypothetical protein
MIIYTDLFNVPSKEVYYSILYHDVPEVITGDVPFMVKRQYPDLKKMLDTIEDLAVYRLNYRLPDISSQEYKQIKIADLTEMLLFAVDDVNMGCVYSIDVIENILEVIGDDTKVRVYLETTGYQRAIDRILATRERQDTRPIQGARELHANPPDHSDGSKELGGFVQHPTRGATYDIPQDWPDTYGRPKSS